MSKTTLTDAQKSLLVYLSGGSAVMRRGDIRTAQDLAKAGLVTLEDNGHPGSADRWRATITEAGKAIAA